MAQPDTRDLGNGFTAQRGRGAWWTIYRDGEKQFTMRYLLGVEARIARLLAADAAARAAR